ncbi:hypothetical protein HYH03_003352 [Edaphochlamys debaryana]|uniref:Uncharacterized protein n=1 Tax=Edaphochlamys debaryana TaxID=47281 RepID=A0A835Y9M2_9CHLO|nr:hypothetical protein HYH03_003352 [Edaphochlamys debaryana]|eukprot:KAG2498603.1 hypothetical protein HYH03_003352 [Edaphochlamys debaryana]
MRWPHPWTDSGSCPCPGSDHHRRLRPIQGPPAASRGLPRGPSRRAAAVAPGPPGAVKALQRSLLGRFPTPAQDVPERAGLLVDRTLKRAVARMMAGAPGHEMGLQDLYLGIPWHMWKSKKRSKSALQGLCDEEPNVFEVSQQERLITLGDAAAAPDPHGASRPTWLAALPRAWWQR